MPKEKRSAWLKIDDEEIRHIDELGKEYMEFVNLCKTERESVDHIIDSAKKKGFVFLDEIKKVSPGQKIMYQAKGKVAALIILGKQDLDKGFNIVVSHTDTPRLDLKSNPLYEEDEFALFKTHYYGGIKKYQWLAIPLALHGVVVKKDGKIVKISVGEEEHEPVFTISDLLPHLAKEQMEKKLGEAISGEGLNALVGNYPDKKAEKEQVKSAILKLLEKKYKIKEADLLSAELQLVPAIKAREVGLDQSMIGAYGHDDRSSVFASLKATLELEEVDRSLMCLFVDKEEIGSVGNTGLQSLLIENLVAELFQKANKDSYLSLRKALSNSTALSADVNGGVDPNYPEVFDKRNACFLSRGVVISKYGGSKGKSGANETSPEFIASLRNLFDEQGVAWQIGELGKVDIGGGGTVAQFLAYYGMEVVDCGVATLGMHSPFEIISKVDLYMAYKAYKAFLSWYK